METCENEWRGSCLSFMTLHSTVSGSSSCFIQDNDSRQRGSTFYPLSIELVSQSLFLLGGESGLIKYWVRPLHQVWMIQFRFPFDNSPLPPPTPPPYSSHGPTFSPSPQPLLQLIIKNLTFRKFDASSKVWGGGVENSSSHKCNPPTTHSPALVAC